MYPLIVQKRRERLTIVRREWSAPQVCALSEDADRNTQYFPKEDIKKKKQVGVKGTK